MRMRRVSTSSIPCSSARSPNWPAQFEHAAALGFDHVLIGSPFVPGSNGHREAVADHHRLHPVFESDASAADGLRQLADAAKKHKLTLLVDIVIDRVSAEGGLYQENKHWFQPFESADARLDPRKPPRQRDVAWANFADGEAAHHLTEWWARELNLLADAGIGGFRFDSPHAVPAHVWRRLGAAVREKHPETRWLAWTVGVTRHDLHGLADAAFDAVFASTRWWDFKSAWLFDEHAALSRIASPITFPEDPFGARLISDLSDTSDTALVERAYTRVLDTAAALGTGIMVPMGFEYGVGLPMSPQYGVAAEYERAKNEKRIDLTARVKRANDLQRNVATLSSVGELRALTGAGTPYAALIRADGGDLRHSNDAVLAVINPDLVAPVHVDTLHLLESVPGNYTRFALIDDSMGKAERLAPVHVEGGRSAPASAPRPSPSSCSRSRR